MKFKNTQEQDQAIELAHTNKTFKINAYAGAGKSTTCKLIAASLPNKKGMYIAFNKAIATDMQSKLTPNVKASTFHSHAYRATDPDLIDKLTKKNEYPNGTVSRYNLQAAQIQCEDTTRSFTTNEQVAVIKKAISNFCSSLQQEPNSSNVIAALPEWIPKEYYPEISEYLTPKVHRKWKELLNPDDSYAITHDVYLKRWALTNPKLNTDFILFDEAQDADPLMLDILSKQESQIIYVGDRHQQIYAWRNAVNAMQNLVLPSCHLSQSFRFGGEITDVANKLLDHLDETVTLIGNPNKQSIVTRLSDMQDKQVILCRTNAGVVGNLLAAIRNKKKVAVEIDVWKMINIIDGIVSLKDKKRTNVSELAGFKDWTEVEPLLQTDKIDQEVKTLAKLLSNNDAEDLKSALTSVSNNTAKNSDYVISSVHKAKGKEWSNVHLHSDFFYKTDGGILQMKPDELRLMYVACTRGIDKLNVTNIDDLLRCRKSPPFKADPFIPLPEINFDFELL